MCNHSADADRCIYVYTYQIYYKLFTDIWNSRSRVAATQGLLILIKIKELIKVESRMMQSPVNLSQLAKKKVTSFLQQDYVLLASA